MKRILVVVDMQKDFIDGSLGTKEAVAIVPAVVRKIRSYAGEPVFATLDTHPEDYLETQEGRRLPVVHCVRGTPGWEINPEVAAALDKVGATRIEKPSFGSLELPERIREAAAGEPFEVELVGLCTDICVVSNALILKAAFPEVRVSVDPSCCAGVTPGSHEAALLTMRMCQVDEGGQGA